MQVMGHHLLFKYLYMVSRFRLAHKLKSVSDNCIRESILARRIRISDILSWDRKSYLTLVILPRLSLEGCTLFCIGTHVIKLSSDVVIMLK